MAARTKSCPELIRLGRLRKANEYLDAALVIEDDMADAFVSLCVLAGIAAADVICCARLGMHAVGDNHNEAVSLLSRADRDVEQHLRTLLNFKSKVSYTHIPATAAEQKRAKRAVVALVEAARRTSATSSRPGQ